MTDPQTVRQDILSKTRSQHTYTTPMPPGMYMGFLVPGLVILKQMDGIRRTGQEIIESHSVQGLLQQS